MILSIILGVLIAIGLVIALLRFIKLNRHGYDRPL